MPGFAYDRLSAQDTMFLVLENPNQPMHVAATAILETGDLARPDGGIDVRKIRLATEAQLHRIPRYRQKLKWVPIEGRPVWVDDPHFSIDYHLRHSAIPKPGGMEELKRLTARILTRPLDRSRPLWEIWIIEGLADGRFAMVSKIHHCMVDGVAGSEIAQILFSPTAAQDIDEPRPYEPRPAPSDAELLASEALHRISAPFELLRSLKDYTLDVGNLRDGAAKRLGAIRELASAKLKRTRPAATDGRLGPNRNVDWVTLPLTRFQDMRRRAGCTINDIVLATVAGAVRTYLKRVGQHPGELEFRVAAPVSTRRDSERGQLGNHVSTWVVPLPIAEPSATARLRAVTETTKHLKQSDHALAVDLLFKVADYAPTSLVSLGARAVTSPPVNMIVTNVPGPQFPLYMLGAKLERLIAMVPLIDGTGLGIALFSYDGLISIGLNADYDLVPDLASFASIFAQAFDELDDALAKEEAAAAQAPSPAAADARKRAPARQRPPRPARVSEAGTTASAS